MHRIITYLLSHQKPYETQAYLVFMIKKLEYIYPFFIVINIVLLLLINTFQIHFFLNNKVTKNPLNHGIL